MKVSVQLASEPTFVFADSQGKYDINTRTVIWDLGEVEAGYGGVLRLTVRVDPAVAEGKVVETTATITGRSGVIVTSAPGRVTVGPVVHQPFFFGYPDGSFGPERPISRAEAAAVIARISELKSLTKGEQVFSDLPLTHWAARYIEAVYRAGIMSGTGDGKFEPERPISRAELAAAMVKMRVAETARFPKGTVLAVEFADLEPQHWAFDLIRTAIALGYVSGFPDGTFEPDGQIGKDAAAKLFCRAYPRGPLADGQTMVAQHFPDVDRGNWAFGCAEETAKQPHRACTGATVSST